MLFMFSVLKDTAAETCRTNERLCDLGNAVDVQVAALLHSLLVAGRLSRLQGLSNKRGGLQDKGRLRLRGRRLMERRREINPETTIASQTRGVQ